SGMQSTVPAASGVLHCPRRLLLCQVAIGRFMLIMIRRSSNEPAAESTPRRLQAYWTSHAFEMAPDRDFRFGVRGHMGSECREMGACVAGTESFTSVAVGTPHLCRFCRSHGVLASTKEIAESHARPTGQMEW